MCLKQGPGWYNPERTEPTRGYLEQSATDRAEPARNVR